MALEVAPVRGRRDLAAFIAFPYSLHRADPHWTAPLRRDVRALALERDAGGRATIELGEGLGETARWYRAAGWL